MRTAAILSMVLLASSCSKEAPCLAEPASIFCPAFLRAASNLSPADKASLTAAGEWPRGTIVSIEGREFLEFGQPVTEFFQHCGISHPEMMGAPFNKGLAQHLRGQAVDMSQICARYKALMIPPLPPPEPGARSNNSFKPNPLRGSA